MGRYASLIGLLGLVALAFGLLALVILRVEGLLPWLHIGAGILCLVAYLAIGFENFLLGQRSMRYGASAVASTVLSSSSWPAPTTWATAITSAGT